MRPMVGALLMALLPSLALAQTPDERIEAARQRALSAGLPVALLESKVAEGRAKGVADGPDRGSRGGPRAALLRSRDAMRVRSDVSPAELGLGAEALQSGVSAAVLTASPNGRRASVAPSPSPHSLSSCILGNVPGRGTRASHGSPRERARSAPQPARAGGRPPSGAGRPTARPVRASARGTTPAADRPRASPDPASAASPASPPRSPSAGPSARRPDVPASPVRPPHVDPADDAIPIRNSIRTAPYRRRAPRTSRCGRSGTAARRSAGHHEVRRGRPRGCRGPCLRRTRR
jgi:hypothetical protein